MKGKHLTKRLAVLATAMILSVAGALTVWAATRLDQVSDYYWDEYNGTVAVWEEVENAERYELYLYCNNRRVAEVKTKKTRYNFEKKMTKEGDYTFRIRALSGDSDYADSKWSDYSDETYIDADFAALMDSGVPVDTTKSGPGMTGVQSTPQTGAQNTAQPGVVSQGKWEQNTIGYWYRRPDGTWPAAEWMQDPADGKWYYFNEQGYMLTGWIPWNGNYYYCLPSGAMVTGTQVIDGTVYNFDASGALIAS